MPQTAAPPQQLSMIRSILMQFWPQICKEKALIVVSIVGLVVEVFASLLGPWPLKLIFDYVLLPDAHNARLDLPFLREASPTVLVLLLSVSIVGTAALSAVSAYISIVSMSVAASRIITEIRSQLYAHLQRLSLAFHYNAKSGDLLTRITSDIDQLRDVTVNHILPLMVNLLTLVSMVTVMFWMDWELALIALAVFPLFLLSTLKITRWARSRLCRRCRWRNF
jgi:ATP-binding cassette, subfamily B, bacterial